ncbi:hypothetical protein GUITHDRAFT_132677 [Guillardia theta CCMP2712]|uniref:PLA2c domain-containing protein n=2 Tax=Guillardia theta TaxID=55529 RepID=L1JYA8_GUITC|nr:hypothetical protein GUITHDRAFT_132677 [Guillardia theta CCMP2712]EKX53566.1 hypothetical protein GUITHDRAFT_132677 [Guillardia theta CCMP2712]|eukprot:XP_005840546.1 hypothetical protein GUITHDRAFT_132677 [Guillardia theta CCMP2712]
MPAKRDPGRPVWYHASTSPRSSQSLPTHAGSEGCFSADALEHLSAHSDVGCQELKSISSGKDNSENYVLRSFDSSNVKSVLVEEWLATAQKSQESASNACDVERECVVVIDSYIESQRRSPWLDWGEFPLLPVGDPPPKTPVLSRVEGIYPFAKLQQASKIFGGRLASDASFSRLSYGSFCSNVDLEASKNQDVMAGENDQEQEREACFQDIDESKVQMNAETITPEDIKAAQEVVSKDTNVQDNSIATLWMGLNSQLTEMMKPTDQLSDSREGKAEAEGQQLWGSALEVAKDVFSLFSLSDSHPHGLHNTSSSAVSFRSLSLTEKECAWDLQVLAGAADGEWVIDSPRLSKGREEGRTLEKGEKEQDKEGKGEKVEQEEGEGWFYSSNFPLGNDNIIRQPVSNVCGPYDYSRWRRWLRRRVIRAMEKYHVSIQYKQGDPVGDMPEEAIPAGSLAVCNICTEMLHVGVYIPADNDTYLLRAGEVVCLEMAAFCKVKSVKGEKALIVASRRSSYLPPIITKENLQRLCVMDPLKYVKKIFIAAMPGQYATDYTTIRSIAHVIGFDGVYAMNKIFTLGCLLAASELGILDCCIYSASLSGSAWLQVENILAMCDISQIEFWQACWMNMKGSCAESLKSLRQWLGLCLQRHPILQAALAEGGQDAVLMERDVKLEFDVQTRKEYMKLRAKLLTSASSFGGSENQPPIAAGAGEEEAMEEDENGGTILLSNLGIETFKMDSSSLFWSDEHVRGVAQLFGDASLHVNNSIMQAQSTIHSLKLRQESRDAFEEEVKQWTAWSSRLRGGKRSANSRMEGMRGVGDLSFVEMYGLLAANAWLPPCPKDRLWRMERGLSSQIESLQLHDRPFPLYVAVGIDHKKVDGEESNEYHWYEFSPFSFSSSQTGKRIPIWSLGRSFHSGRSCSVTPEFPLGVCMGIWGAAFTASTEEVKKNYRNTSSRAQSRRDVVQIIHDTFNILDSNSSDQAIDEVSQVKTSSRAGSIRVVEPFQCFNPFFEDPSHLEEDPCTGCPPSKPSSSFTHPHHLTAADAETSDLRLTDAGIHMNAPLPALLRRERASDVIILLDSRSTSGEADVNDSFDVLKPAEEYAKQRDLPFPSIRDQDLIEIGRRRCTVLGFEEDSAPEIVYMPLVKNEEVDEDLDPLHTPWCDFMEFAYEPEHFERLFQETRSGPGTRPVAEACRIESS